MILLDHKGTVLTINEAGDLVAENATTQLLLFKNLSAYAILRLCINLFHAATLRKRGPALGQAIMAMRGIAE